MERVNSRRSVKQHATGPSITRVGYSIDMIGIHASIIARLGLVLVCMYAGIAYDYVQLSLTADVCSYARYNSTPSLLLPQTRVLLSRPHPHTN